MEWAGPEDMVTRADPAEATERPELAAIVQPLGQALHGLVGTLLVEAVGHGGIEVGLNRRGDGGLDVVVRDALRLGQRLERSGVAQVVPELVARDAECIGRCFEDVCAEEASGDTALDTVREAANPAVTEPAAGVGIPISSAPVPTAPWSA